MPLHVGFILRPLWGDDPRLLTGATLWGYISLIKQGRPKAQPLGGNTNGIFVKPRFKMRHESTLNSHGLKTHHLLTPYQSLWVPWASLTCSSVPSRFEMPTSKCILRGDLGVPCNPGPYIKQ